MELRKHVNELTAIMLEREELLRRQEKAVRAARLDGLSWERVGQALGMSKQGAWEQFRHVDKFN